MVNPEEEQPPAVPAIQEPQGAADDSFSEKNMAQRRGAERKVARKHITLQRYVRGSLREPEKAIIIDISVTGIGLLISTPMKFGDQFLLLITPKDPGVVYRVMRCRPCGDIFHRVGAAFIHRVGSLGEEIDRLNQAILQ